MTRTSSFWLSVTGAFFLVALMIYGQSLGNAFVRWDDGLLIYENPAIRGITWQHLKTIFTTYDPELYIPLTLFSYQIDYLISGNNPAFYHLHNLVLHVLNAVLVAGVLRLFIKKTWIAVACGALFLLHPLHTEAVAWSSARKDLLSALLMLVSFICYFRYRITNRHLWYGISLATFALGLLAKVTILGLPILLLAGVWLRERTVTKRTWLESLPYFGFSGLFAVIAMFGKTTMLSSVTLTETIAMAGKSTVFYLSKLIVPIKLSVLYPYNEQIMLSKPDFLIPIIIVSVLIGGVLLSLKTTRYIAFAAAFYAVTLAPSLLNFAKGGTYYIASDRYAYLPSIGFLLLLAAGLYRLKDQRIAYGVVAVLTVIFAYGAHTQAAVWNNSETLFLHTLTHYPNSHAARNNIGNVYRRNGQLDAAIAQYQAALDIAPYAGRQRPAIDQPSVGEQNRAQILSNLAAAYRAQGKLDRALSTFTEALNLAPKNPQVHLGLAITKQQLGVYDEAEEHFLRAIELQPNLAVAYLNLGALYVNTGDTEGGIVQYEEAINRNPHFPQAHYNLGVALRKLQRNREAKEAFEKAVALEPSFVAARINLGILYAERQDIPEAIEQFQEVLKYDPGNQNALSALSQLGAL